MAKHSVADLANVSLAKWTVRRVFEVYMTDGGGMGQHVKTIGWFFDRDLAQAFKDQQEDSSFCNTGEAWALVESDLHYGFLLKDTDPAFEFMNEFKARKAVKKSVMKKLTPAERRIVTGKKDS